MKLESKFNEGDTVIMIGDKNSLSNIKKASLGGVLTIQKVYYDKGWRYKCVDYNPDMLVDVDTYDIPESELLGSAEAVEYLGNKIDECLEKYHLMIDEIATVFNQINN